MKLCIIPPQSVDYAAAQCEGDEVALCHVHHQHLELKLGKVLAGDLLAGIWLMFQNM